MTAGASELDCYRATSKHHRQRSITIAMILKPRSSIVGLRPLENQQADEQPSFHRTKLNILMNEDVAADAELIKYELIKSGLMFRFKSFWTTLNEPPPENVSTTTVLSPPVTAAA